MYKMVEKGQKGFPESGQPQQEGTLNRKTLFSPEKGPGWELNSRKLSEFFYIRIFLNDALWRNQ